MSFTKALTVSKFDAWLSGQLPTRRFRGQSCDTCPLAQYLTDMNGGNIVDVGGARYFKRGSDREYTLPVWAHLFRIAFDKAVNRRVVGPKRVKEIFLASAVRKA